MQSPDQFHGGLMASLIYTSPAAAGQIWLYHTALYQAVSGILVRGPGLLRMVHPFWMLEHMATYRLADMALK